MKILLVPMLLTFFVENYVKGVIVHEVQLGKTAILPCPSNDKHHRFQYWQLKNDQIIGPWNNNPKHKFKYEVWSGRLIISSVSDTESGFYKCFSKQILGNELQAETVELLVKRDWIESFENDSRVNTYKAVFGLLGFLILALLGFLAFFIKRRRSLIFQESREGSPEQLISPTDSKGVYKPTNISMSKLSMGIKKSSDKSLENAIVETDISTSFSLAN